MTCLLSQLFAQLNSSIVTSQLASAAESRFLFDLAAPSLRQPLDCQQLITTPTPPLHSPPHHFTSPWRLACAPPSHAVHSSSSASSASLSARRRFPRLQWPAPQTAATPDPATASAGTSETLERQEHSAAIQDALAVPDPLVRVPRPPLPPPPHLVLAPHLASPLLLSIAPQSAAHESDGSRKRRSEIPDAALRKRSRCRASSDVHEAIDTRTEPGAPIAPFSQPYPSHAGAE